MLRIKSDFAKTWLKWILKTILKKSLIYSNSKLKVLCMTQKGIQGRGWKLLTIFVDPWFCLLINLCIWFFQFLLTTVKPTPGGLLVENYFRQHHQICLSYGSTTNVINYKLRISIRRSATERMFMCNTRYFRTRKVVITSVFLVLFSPPNLRCSFTYLCQ